MCRLSQSCLGRREAQPLSVWPAPPPPTPHLARLDAAAWAAYLLLQRSFQSIHSQLLLPQTGLVGSLLLLGLASDLGDLGIGPAGRGEGKGVQK